MIRLGHKHDGPIVDKILSIGQHFCPSVRGLRQKILKQTDAGRLDNSWILGKENQFQGPFCDPNGSIAFISHFEFLQK